MAVLAVMLSGVISSVVPPTIASAENVVQMTGGGTWIWVYTGSKNYSNRTQWVSRITVMTGRGGACPGRLEGWTYGWYASEEVCGQTERTFWISRWIPSGNGVCGASRNIYGGRDVACITIRV
jgi:hypothetical protein